MLVDLLVEGAGAPKEKIADLKFEAFWKAFPVGRKIGKGAARTAYKKALLRTNAEKLLSAAQKYAATQPDPRYVPMPSRWLNESRWEDDSAESSMVSPSLPHGEGAVGPNGRRWGWWRGMEVRGVEVSRSAIEKYKPNGTWPWHFLGAPPGDLECIIHPDVLAERAFIEKYKGKVTHD